MRCLSASTRARASLISSRPSAIEFSMDSKRYIKDACKMSDPEVHVHHRHTTAPSEREGRVDSSAAIGLQCGKEGCMLQALLFRIYTIYSVRTDFFSIHFNFIRMRNVFGACAARAGSASLAMTAPHLAAACVLPTNSPVSRGASL